jgi:hypothetical protein
MQADVFLSYAEEDRARAGAVSNALEALGWSVWWDREIAPGSTWRETIERAIEGTRCMVVLWSESALASRWVHEEAEEGLARARLVPVLIEQVRPPMGFRSVQACDLSDWEGDPAAAEFVALTRAISNLVGPPPKGAPVQSSTPLPPGESPRRGIRRYAWGVAVVMAASVLAVVGMWRWGSPAPTPVPLPVSIVVESSPPPIAPPEPDRIPAPSPAPLGNGARVATVPEAALPAAPKPEVPTLEVPKAPAPKLLAAPRIAPKAETRLSSSTLSASCTAVLERMQLGEPVSDSERKECTR